MTVTTYTPLAAVNTKAVADQRYIADFSFLAFLGEEVTLAAAEAATNAAIAREAAEEAGAFIYTSYADAVAGLNLIADGVFVKVLVDETRNGRQAIYRVEPADPVSVLFDFSNNTYSTGVPERTLIFVRFPGLNLVDTPATSTSLGFFGDIALDSNFVYFAIGVNQWRRIALGTF